MNHILNIKINGKAIFLIIFFIDIIKKVLCVEDNDPVIAILKGQVKNIFDIIAPEAKNLKEDLKIIKNSTPDIISPDNTMPVTPALIEINRNKDADYKLNLE